MSSEEIKESSEPVILFGRDIRKIPCFKQSMLNGIYGGIASGLITFLVTSRVRQSTNVALGSYMAIATAYWCHCRYKYVMDKNALLEIQQLIEQRQFERLEKKCQNEQNDQ